MIPVLFLCIFYFLPMIWLKDRITDALTFKIVAIVYLVILLLIVPTLYLIYLSKHPVDEKEERLKEERKTEEERKHDKDIADSHLAFAVLYLFVLFLIYFISSQNFRWEYDQLFTILLHSATFLFISDFLNAITCKKINYIVFEFNLLAAGTILGLLIVHIFEEVFWIIVGYLVFVYVISSNFCDWLFGG